MFIGSKHSYRNPTNHSKQKTQLSNILTVAFLFCDPGRIRTPNPQSRNLIFYPVELLGRPYTYAVNSFFTTADMVFPSAAPANLAFASPITFPISCIPEKLPSFTI